MEHSSDDRQRSQSEDNEKRDSEMRDRLRELPPKENLHESSFMAYCAACNKLILDGLEFRGKKYCSKRCIPRGPAKLPDEIFEHMALDYLVDDLGASLDDPDFPRWLERCTRLFERYKPLQEKCDKPLGTTWPGEDSKIISEVLDTLERKIKAAEEMFGLT